MKKLILSVTAVFISVLIGGSVFAFSDVATGHKYYDAIEFVSAAEVVSGYPDGSYKPEKTLNRAELLKIIVESMYVDEFEIYSGQNCFNDVPATEWYTKYVCFAKAMGIVEGYAGNLFKPSQDVNFVEALKMTMETFLFIYDESDPWYKNLVEEASYYNFIPLDVTSFDQKFNRGQMADMITRILAYSLEIQNSYLQGLADDYVTYETILAGTNVENLAYDFVCSSEMRVCEDGFNAERLKASCDFYCPEDPNPYGETFDDTSDDTTDDTTSDDTSDDTSAGFMTLSTTAFENVGQIEDFYTCDSYDFNPPLTISGVPDGTESMVLFVDDYDVIFNHWVVWDILPSTTEIDQDSVPGTEGTNDFGEIGYGGPCPPIGETHEYVFTVYALNTTLGLPEGSTSSEVAAAMLDSYIIDSASLTGTYY